MQNRFTQEKEIPLYNQQLVDSLFTRFAPVHLGQTISLFGGEVAVSFFPAGHILGAACLGFESDGAHGSGSESIFFSGDISVTPQLTVGGMLPPVSIDHRFKPQVVMVESTYGNRLHANRASEERRLVERVAQVVERGGRVLIPAFAVGRAQEVLLILAKAMAKGVIAPFPVWVDGMVRSVCQVYTQHPYDLTTTLRRQIERTGNPFFGAGSALSAGSGGGGNKAKENGNLDRASNFKRNGKVEFSPITTPQERQRLAESGQAGCIVASSGMLSGGPSAFYARYLVKEANSAIFITGYQDEESPGRALLALAETTDPQERILKLEGESVAVACQVGKYSLSAHVDAGEVAALIEQLDPQETVLVHGAGGAREALSELLMQSKERRVNLPYGGDELGFAGRKTARAKRLAQAEMAEATAVTAGGESGPPLSLAQTPRQLETNNNEDNANPTDESPSPSAEGADSSGLLPASPDQLHQLRDRLTLELGEKVATSRKWTLQELEQRWRGWQNLSAQSAKGLSAEEYTLWRELLAQSASGFEPDPRRPFLYRLRRASALTRAPKATTAPTTGPEGQAAPALPLEQNAALRMVDRFFPPASLAQTGLYKRGANRAELKLLLWFYFPQTASERYQTELALLAEKSGWHIELNTEAHQGALVAAVSKLMPIGARLAKAPALYPTSHEVRVSLLWQPQQIDDEASGAAGKVAPSWPTASASVGGTEAEIENIAHCVPEEVGEEVALRPLAASSAPEHNPTLAAHYAGGGEEEAPLVGETTSLSLENMPPTESELTPQTIEARLAQFTQAFATLTGYTLLPSAVADQPLQNQPHAGEGNQPAPLEINAAFRHLDQAFGEEASPSPLLKRSLKYGAGGPFIELSFITQEKGESYRQILDTLEKEIGWSLTINPQPHHQALAGLATELVGQSEFVGLSVKKVGLHQVRHELALKLAYLGTMALPQAVLTQWHQRFAEQTGWKLGVEIEQNGMKRKSNTPGANGAALTPIKPTQYQMILALVAKMGWEQATFEGQLGKPLGELSRKEASEWLDQLNRATKGKASKAKSAGGVR
jgi:Cft2 family RNA processing exonuclease